MGTDLCASPSHTHSHSPTRSSPQALGAPGAPLRLTQARSCPSGLRACPASASTGHTAHYPCAPVLPQGSLLGGGHVPSAQERPRTHVHGAGSARISQGQPGSCLREPKVSQDSAKVNLGQPVREPRVGWGQRSDSAWEQPMSPGSEGGLSASGQGGSGTLLHPWD